MMQVLIAVLFLLQIPFEKKVYATNTISEDFQAKIVKLYSDNQCKEVQKISLQTNLNLLSPNVMAIAAFCEPVGYDPEDLFLKAETARPTGDLILILHAKYRSKKKLKSATELWQRVLLIARNDYFRNIAKAHLASENFSEKENIPLNLSPSTGFGKFFIAGKHQTNAEPSDFVYQPEAPSNALTTRADLTYRHWYGFGSVAIHNVSSYDRFFSAPQYNLWSNTLEIPIALHIVSAKDLIFKPLVSYSHIGATSLDFLYGLSVGGAVFHSAYKQSVQGIVYTNKVFVPELSTTSGAHYRFEYQWDFYPQLWLLESTLSIEHVSAKSTDLLFGSRGLFEMSHTDIGIALKFEREISKLTLGIAPKFLFRVDSNDSVYKRPFDNAIITKQRQDWDVSLQGNASLPIFATTQLYAWYEWRRIYSNFDKEDIVDRNFKNQTIGLGVKVSLSTY